MITWLDQDSFSSELLNTYTPDLRDVLLCSFRIAKAKLEELIGIPSHIVLEPEPFTEPGPYMNWFGHESGIYFFLTCYLTELSDLKYCSLSIVTERTLNPDWSLLTKLNLSDELISHLNWVLGHENASHSVYSKDENDLEFELYRAINDQDALQLKTYLLENGFLNYLLVAKSEEPGAWIVKKGNEIIARYTSRYTSESFALRKSGLENVELIVSAPDIPNSSKSVFKNGRKILT